MRAMILAAGRGERLRPLTDTCPKPLIKVGGRPLIEWHILKLKAAGINEIVVNSAWLSSMIQDYLSDGRKFGVQIQHSVETMPGGLETAGGIIKALPLLGERFLVINGDTYIDADYRDLMIPDQAPAHLFLVQNPPHHIKGDFDLAANGEVSMGNAYTFSGAALYAATLFKGFQVQRLALRPLFEQWSQQHLLHGSVLKGAWFDAGTVERLNLIENYLKQNQPS